MIQFWCLSAPCGLKQFISVCVRVQISPDISVVSEFTAHFCNVGLSKLTAPFCDAVHVLTNFDGMWSCKR